MLLYSFNFIQLNQNNIRCGKLARSYIWTFLNSVGTIPILLVSIVDTFAKLSECEARSFLFRSSISVIIGYSFYVHPISFSVCVFFIKFAYCYIKFCIIIVNERCRGNCWIKHICRAVDLLLWIFKFKVSTGHLFVSNLLKVSTVA